MVDGLKIVVVGSRTGVGKSFFVANFYSSVSQLADGTITLVDAHVQNPALRYYFSYLPEPIIEEVKVRIPEISIPDCTFCGSCVQFCNYDAILMHKETNHIKVLDDFCTSCGACVYACNDNAITEREEVSGKINDFKSGAIHLVEGEMKVIRPMVSPLIKKINTHIADSNMSIVDSPPGNSFSFIESLDGASFVILLTDYSEKSVAGMKTKVNLLKESNISFGVVINKGIGNREPLDRYLSKEGLKPLLEVYYSDKYAFQNSKSEFSTIVDPDLALKMKSLFSKIVSICEEAGV